MAQGAVVVACCCLVMCLGLWFGLFFGLNYPEIRINTLYKETECEVVSTPQTLRRFCCGLRCSCPGECTAGSPTCASLTNRAQQLKPENCTDWRDRPPGRPECPDEGRKCCNGYACCKRCCQTCTSCSSSGKSRSCSTYSCNCYCCSSASNQDCELSCDVCYRVEFQISYWTGQKAGHGDEYRPVLQQEFGADLTGATQFKTDYALGTTHQCFFNPENHADVIFSRGYTWWKWLLTAFPTAFLFLILCAGTCAFIEGVVNQDYYDHGSRICGFKRRVVVVQIACWIGFLFPICFFLPLWTADLPRSGKDTLVCFMTSFTVIGWYPLAVHGAGKRGLNFGVVNFIYVILVAVPIGVFIPVATIADVSSETQTALAVLAGVLPPLACCFFTCFKPRQWDDIKDKVRTSNTSENSGTSSSYKPRVQIQAASWKDPEEEKRRAELEELRKQNEELERRLAMEQAAIDARLENERGGTSGGYDGLVPSSLNAPPGQPSSSSATSSGDAPPPAYASLGNNGY